MKRSKTVDAPESGDIGAHHTHQLTRRGFFSEYLVMLWVKLFCDLNGIAFTLLVTNKSLVTRGFAEELFDVDVIARGPLSAAWRQRLTPTGDRPGHSQARLSGHLMPTNWNNLWNRAREEALGDAAYVLARMHALHAAVWRSGDRAHHTVAKPDIGRESGSYVAMHVRRGDKLIREAVFVKPDRYLSLIPSDLRHLPIVVVTDDYQAYLEVKACLATTSPRLSVTTTAARTANGYSNADFLKLHVASRDKHIRALLVDFAILCQAAFAVCSFSSNIGRAVHIARSGEGTASVDIPFSVVV